MEESMYGDWNATVKTSTTIKGRPRGQNRHSKASVPEGASIPAMVKVLAD